MYATLFPEQVQAVIGQPNETAKAAVRILEKIGFRYLNQVDPFDGGPYYGASREAISSVRERRALVLPGLIGEPVAPLRGPARAARGGGPRGLPRHRGAARRDGRAVRLQGSVARRSACAPATAST